MRTPVFTDEHLPEQALSRAVVGRLSVLVGILAAAVAVVGLAWQGSGASFSVVTPRGQVAEIFGRGIYRNDTLFIVGNNRGSDLVTLVLALPLLVASLSAYRRGSLRGRYLLLGSLGFFLYTSATYALGGVAYNEMFLVYVAFFACSLFAFVVTFLDFDFEALRRDPSKEMPRRLAGRFMIVSGVATLAIWLMEPIASLLAAEPPQHLGPYTTLFTNSLDMAVIVPAAIVAGVLILRGRKVGYAVAFSLLVLEALLLPMITVATIAQVRMGIEFKPAEIIGPIAGFALLSGFSIWVMVSILRSVPAGGRMGDERDVPS